MQDAIAAVFRRFARVASPRAYLRRRCSTVLGPGIVTKAASVTGSRFWLGAPGVLASDDVDLLRSESKTLDAAQGLVGTMRSQQEASALLVVRHRAI